MITALSLTLNTLTVILDNGAQIIPVRSDNPKWGEILELAKQFDVVDGKLIGPEDKLLSLLSLKAIVETYSVGALSVNSTGVTYRGKPLHTIDSARVLAFLRDGLPYKPIANYIARKMANPSARAITELYNFLEHKNMPITPEGKIIAYKGVNSSLYSVHGNLETVVLQGKVDEGGHIFNEIGATIEVERSSVDDNFKNHCSFGLHAGSLQYAKGWGSRMLLVEIDPADVVSIPDDCACQKLRCCKYKVLGEYTGPMPHAYSDEFSSGSTETNSEESSSESEPCTNCGETDCDGSCEDQCSRCGADSCDGNCDQENVTEDSATVSTPSTSSKDEIAQVVRRIIVDGYSPLPPHPQDFALSFIGLDELDEVELTMELEAKFNQALDDDALEVIFKTKTFSDLVEHIYNKLNPSAPVVEAQVAEVTPLDQKFVDGKQDGYCDRQALTPPKFLVGDWDGADSEVHAAYIKGYVEGYTS